LYGGRRARFYLSIRLIEDGRRNEVFITRADTDLRYENSRVVMKGGRDGEVELGHRSVAPGQRLKRKVACCSAVRGGVQFGGGGVGGGDDMCIQPPPPTKIL